MVCNSRSPRRAGEPMRPTATRSSCFAPGAGLPLRFSRESSGTACGEERCAGSFWTNGVRGDASKMLLVSYRPLAIQIAVESFASNPCHSSVSRG